MIEQITFEEGFGSVKFDRDRPLDLVRVTGKEIRHARIQPDSYNYNSQSYREIWEPHPVPSALPPQVPKKLSEHSALRSNRRTSLGKIGLPIPDGFTPRFIETLGWNPIKVELLRGLQAQTNENDLKIVVDGIITIDKDRFRKGDLTHLLRNKGLRARDIETALRLLTDRYHALKEINSKNVLMPKREGRPPQEYLVLWGASDFFPPKTYRKMEEE